MKEGEPCVPIDAPYVKFLCEGVINLVHEKGAFWVTKEDVLTCLNEQLNSPEFPETDRQIKLDDLLTRLHIVEGEHREAYRFVRDLIRDGHETIEKK